MTSGLLAAAGPSPLWYLTRGTGLVALLLLTATVVLGIATTARWSGGRWPRFLTNELHRRVCLIVVVLLVVHIVTAELDTYAPVGWLSVIVPFASRYRAVWLGFGTVAFDLLLAVGITSLLRFRIGPRLWRAVHWSAYACWPAALVHGLGTGTDARLGPVQALSVVCLLAVLLTLAGRLIGAEGGRGGRRLVGGAVSVAAALVIGAWAVQGPLRAGWSKRAGTPSSLLTGTRITGASPVATAPSSTSPSAPPATGGLRLPFTDTLAGTVHQASVATGGQTSITIRTRLRGSTVGTLRIVLRGTASGGGISLQSSGVSLRAAGHDLGGRVVALSGDEVAASVSGGGQRLGLAVALRIDPAAGTVSGTVTATASAAGGGAP